MIWVFFTVMAVLLVGGFAALVTGRLGYDPMAEATTTQSVPSLPEDFAPEDISGVRFDTALRGYRMDQVDAVLDRLQARIAELEGFRGAAELEGNRGTAELEGPHGAVELESPRDTVR